MQISNAVVFLAPSRLVLRLEAKELGVPRAEPAAAHYPSETIERRARNENAGPAAVVAAPARVFERRSGVRARAYGHPVPDPILDGGGG